MRLGHARVALERHLPDLVSHPFFDDEVDLQLRIVRRPRQPPPHAHVKEPLVLVELLERADVVIDRVGVERARAEDEHPEPRLRHGFQPVARNRVVADEVHPAHADVGAFHDVEHDDAFGHQQALIDRDVGVGEVLVLVVRLDRAAGHRDAERVDRLPGLEVDDLPNRGRFDFGVADEADLANLPLLGELKHDDDAARRALDLRLDVGEAAQLLEDALVVLGDRLGVERVTDARADHVADDGGGGLRVADDADVFDRPSAQLGERRRAARDGGVDRRRPRLRRRAGLRHHGGNEDHRQDG